jgi:hypothetical protein
MISKWLVAASKGSRETNRRMKVLSVNVGRPREAVARKS